jgi:hypothetical protein
VVSEVSAHFKTAVLTQKVVLKKTAQAESKAKDVLNAEGEVKRLAERLKTLKGRLSNVGGDEKTALDAVTALTNQVKALEEELADLQDQLAALNGGAPSAGAGAKQSARGKGGKKGAGAGEGAGSGAGGDAMEVDQETAGKVNLDDKDRSEYTRLKAQERAQTADDRESMDRLKREQGDAEAEAGKLKAIVDAAGKRVEEIEAR